MYENLKDGPLITIVTIVYNNVSKIKFSLESVISQNYSNIEYIVIDGNSNDGTLDIINNYKDNISLIVSEPDKGIYDAINKGVELANGDIVGFLHSDDIFASQTIISDIADEFKSGEVDAIYGDIELVSQDNTDKVVRYWKAGKYSLKEFKRGWMPPHPSFYVKRECYKKYGNYNLDYPINADYDLMIRFLITENINCIYIPKTIVKMRVGGNSGKLSNQIAKNYESYRILKDNSIGGLFATVMKNLRKIKQLYLRAK